MESFLKSNTPDTVALCDEKLDNSVDFSSFFYDSLTSINPIGLLTCIILHFNVKEALYFAQDFSLEKSDDIYLCFRLDLSYSEPYIFSSIDHCLPLCAWHLTIFFKIVSYSLQGWAATTRHRFTRKRRK